MLRLDRPTFPRSWRRGGTVTRARAAAGHVDAGGKALFLYLPTEAFWHPGLARS